MGDIFTNLKRTFNSGNILAKLIYINVGLFVIIRLASVILMLFNLGGFPFLQYLQVPSSPELLLYRPWTIITYMFTHFDFLHILFNMLWLYWFGGLFLTFFSERQLGGLYLLGGIAGAVLFLVADNIFPYFRSVAAYSYLMGAAAAVMAIVFAVSFYRSSRTFGTFQILFKAGIASSLLAFQQSQLTQYHRSRTNSSNRFLLLGKTQYQITQLSTLLQSGRTRHTARQ